MKLKKGLLYMKPRGALKEADEQQMLSLTRGNLEPEGHTVP